jgi:hypothetical protein
MPKPSREWVERFWRLSARAIVDAVARVLDAVSAALKDETNGSSNGSPTSATSTDPKSA